MVTPALLCDEAVQRWFQSPHHSSVLNRWNPGDLSWGVCQQRLCHTAELWRRLHRGHPGAPPGPWKGLLYYNLRQIPAQLLWHVTGHSLPHEETHPRDPRHQTHRLGEEDDLELKKTNPVWSDGTRLVQNHTEIQYKPLSLQNVFSYRRNCIRAKNIYLLGKWGVGKCQKHWKGG